MAPAIMCFGRKPSAADPESRKNAEIEKNLRSDRKRAEREVKLLLLGRPTKSLLPFLVDFD
jgi:guanine nucleotide-binding protein subunit alpha